MDSILSLLGLAYRAKKILLGENVLDNLKKCRFIFIASDTSDGNKERYYRKCSYYGIDYNDSYSSQQLSKALGKKTVKLIGVIDAGFQKLIVEKGGKNG